MTDAVDSDGGKALGTPADVVQHAEVRAAGHVVQAGRDAVITFRQAARRVAWPVRVGLPPGLADHYRKRPDYDLVAEVLAAGRGEDAIGRTLGVVVSGLGGVGKSQLAARYAWSRWSDASLDVALWISAVSRDAVVIAYAEAAARVLVDRDPQIAERPPEQAAKSFREWLAATSRRWLVVLDDVQDPVDLRDLSPPPSAAGQVILTSRRRDAALRRGEYRVVELDVFDADEAVAYLTGALGRDADPAQLRGLAVELGRLPLALGQAAAFILDQPLLSVADYRAMLADRRRTLAELAPPEDALPEHQATVAATWSLSIERADSVRPGVARLLLEVTSLLDANGTPLGVFTDKSIVDHLADRIGGEVRVGDVHDGLTRLHRYHLITLDPGRPGRAVAVHALVQRAVRDTIAPDRLPAPARAAADALHAVWPEIDTTDAELTQALRSCVDSLRAHAILYTDDLHPVLERAGESLGQTGQVHAAIAYWHALHDEVNAHLGADHPATLTTRHHLVAWQAEAGDLARAVPALESLLADERRLLGADHPRTLATRSRLAWWRAEAGDVDRAAAELESLLADRVRVLGPDHPDTLTTRANLARRRGEAGDPARAAVEYQALLADRLRVLGPDHPDPMKTRQSLAFWRGRTGDLAGAVAELVTLLADRLRVLGPDHPSTLITRSTLAQFRGEAGDPAGAAADLTALLADRLRVLGADHPKTLATRGRRAHWLGEAGDPGAAAAELEALLADQRRILGPDYPHIAATAADLARWRGVAPDVGEDRATPS
ncbi:tetratricopeptide repeat protein [Actinosynnema sp. NPDC004786]